MENQPRMPETNLVWAILCTVLCCLPLGIVAIVKATSVEKLWYQGLHTEALKASEDAKRYSIYGAIAGGVFMVIYFILVLTAAIGGLY